MDKEERVNVKPWEFLRGGEPEFGIQFIRERYVRDPSPSHTMELGVGYMWVKDYTAAHDHFQRALESNPARSSEHYFGFAGAAKCCIGEDAAAVSYWQRGVDAAYALSGVCLHSPMLLFLASILRPGLFPRKEAERILKLKLADPRVREWPGLLVSFLLGDLEEPAVEKTWIRTLGNDRGSIKPEARWLTEFYSRAKKLGRGESNVTEFRETMRLLTETSGPEWLEDRDFLHLLWNEEFFIARHEAAFAS